MCFLGDSWPSARRQPSYNLKRQRAVDWSTVIGAALDTIQIMGLGPVLCGYALYSTPSYSNAEHRPLELNEAFAAQVLACQAAGTDADFSRRVLVLDGRWDAFDHRRLNIDGGGSASASGWPPSGNRIVLASEFNALAPQWPQARNRHRNASAAARLWRHAESQTA